MKKLNLIRSIKSNEFALTVAILSVLVQSFHSFTAFYNMSSLKGSAAGIIQAVLFAIVVDLAVLFYTVRNKKDVVLFASIFLFVINAYYYFSHWGFTWELIFAAFLSILVPVTQYYYSEEIKDEAGYGDEKYFSDLKIKELESIIRNGKAENERLGKRIDEEQAVAKKYAEHIKELDEHLGRRLKDLEDAESLLRKAEHINKKLLQDYDLTVAQRDSALNGNSVLSEALGRRVKEIHDLKIQLGQVPAGSTIDLEAERAKIEDEIQDKSLLNIEKDLSNYATDNKGSYEPTFSSKPIV